MINNKLPKVWYGGDYNPEQWDRAIWAEDMKLFDKANIDIATINVFNWAMLQPSEEEYDFSVLDEVMKHLLDHNIGVCMGTSTAAHPAWMAKRYPDILRVDWEGRKRKYGGRHNSCPHSPTYRKYSVRLARKLAERYGDWPNLLMWHISNEYCGYCYCNQCAAAFRTWLKGRYGTLDQLNTAWYTRFWGHTFYDWEEIVPPNMLSEGVHWNYQRSNQNSISLDYCRFQSDSLLECYLLEREELRGITPSIPITTNFMGTYKELDYFRWAKELDVISWDSYPAPHQPPSVNAMTHDLMRGLKAGQPFMLMEQTPSHANWQPYCSLKVPGEMRKWSYQAVSRGADTVMFFQLRKSAGSCEKFHGAVIEHAGHGNTRVFRECAELGAELAQLGEAFLDARVEAEVGILYDWENRWAVELSSGPSNDLDYVNEVHKFYGALYAEHIQTDLVGLDADWSRYKVLIAPVLYMVKPGVADKLEQFARQGGTIITTYFSGIVSESDLVTVGGYPGELRSLLGIWSEEIDALYPGKHNKLVLERPFPGSEQLEYACEFLCDLIHAETAEVAAVYGGDKFYKGRPALTVNKYGEGEAWYMATTPEPAFMQAFLRERCEAADIKPLIPKHPGIEASRRTKDGVHYLFLLNHTEAEIEVRPELRQAAVNILNGEAAAEAIMIPPQGTVILTYPS
ncbi:beta-galactosidase [Paenibacillus sp. GCM10023252]|uniref:beta-galactosidase n=1 Tax=Paenibacillus sp. GCM10023252 TaxID=3252649 RepID=UPI00360EC543